MRNPMTPTDNLLMQPIPVYLKSRQIEIEYLEILVEFVPIQVRCRLYSLAIEISEVADQFILQLLDEVSFGQQ